MKKAVFIWLSVFSHAIGQDSLNNDIINKITQEQKLFRNKNFVALPVAFRFPETRWGGGVAGAASFGFSRDKPDAKMSQISFGATFTQNKQILLFVPFKIFLKDDKYYLFSENGWYRFNYVYGGIGENRVPDEKYDVDYFRLRLLVAQKLNYSTYIGLRLNFENYNITGTAEGGELSTGLINGSRDSRTSGVGLSVLKDTRDDVFYPTKGIFGEFFIVPSSRIFGANRNFTKISGDFSYYLKIHKNSIFAQNLVAISNIGDVPFNQLAYLGGQLKMRGILEGYFRDNNALIYQTELRQKVWKKLGAVAFGSVAFLGNQEDILRLQKPKFTYGAGLRLATKNNLNLRLDYALSPYTNGNFYATIGEAF
jgi:outer membrane protein assembly factor BamA